MAKSGRSCGCDIKLVNLFNVLKFASRREKKKKQKKRRENKRIKIKIKRTGKSRITKDKNRILKEGVEKMMK